MKKLKQVMSALLAVCMAICLLPVSALAEDTANTSGTFTAVSMNVDGLPNKIWSITINGDGPGSAGTKAISSKLYEQKWDIIGVSEDFNYNTELLSAMTDYKSGTHRGGVSGLSNDTDGLNLLWKNSIAVSGEKWTSWNTHYSTGIFGTGNGADGMIDKGYRYYQATVAEGVNIDIYILHMDADSDAGDIKARESQLAQLANAIKASNNKNPIIVMGDTNCRYTRENLEKLFIDAINADSRFTINDAWIEKIRDGKYPTYGADALVAKDKGGTYDYPDAEIVDKLFYINNTDSDVTLTANSYKVATNFTDENGNALADHWPIVVDFSYSVNKKDTHTHSYAVTSEAEATCTQTGSKTYTCSCGDTYTEPVNALGHAYKAQVTAPTCTENGYTTYTCERCEDTYRSDEIDALGHNYVNGICTRCKATDPNYQPGTEEPSEMTLGKCATSITSGRKYAIVYPTALTAYSIAHSDSGSLATAKINDLTEGAEVDPSVAWIVTQEDNGYTLSTVINGETMYLVRTKTFSGNGYKIALQAEPAVWTTKTNPANNTFYLYSKVGGSQYSLRYYNARQGWIVCSKIAPVRLYEINE